MTSKEKKEYWAFGVIIAIIAIFWAYELFGGHSAAPAPTSPTLSTSASSSSTGIFSGATSATSTNSANLPYLPNGSTLSTSVLTNPAFTQLIPPNYPTVSAADVGIQNPFATQAAPAAPSPTPTQ